MKKHLKRLMLSLLLILIIGIIFGIFLYFDSYSKEEIELEKTIHNSCLDDMEGHFTSVGVSTLYEKQIRVFFYYANFKDLDAMVMNTLYNKVYDIIFVDNKLLYGDYKLHIFFDPIEQIGGVSDGVNLFNITEDKSCIRLVNNEKLYIKDLATICPDTADLDGYRDYFSPAEYQGFKNLKRVCEDNMETYEKGAILSIFPECEFYEYAAP